VKKWRFEPARKSDKSVAVETNLDGMFSLTAKAAVSIFDYEDSCR